MMRNPLLRVGLLSTLTLLAACTTTQEPETPVKKTVETRFEAIEFSALPDIVPADWQAALEAFQTGCEPLGKRPNWRDVCRRAVETGPQDAETFFRSNFTP
ncbi:MAG TPA: transglycosylase, partial [Candidatus Sutterella merdavium]|nr:transglycosylase [Candidatus Sutterella merdavium]